MPTTLDDLPDELMLCIFAQLSENEKLAAGRVCARWRGLCIDAALWRAPVALPTALLLANQVAGTRLQLDVSVTYEELDRLRDALESAREMRLEFAKLGRSLHRLGIMDPKKDGAVSDEIRPWILVLLNSVENMETLYLQLTWPGARNWDETANFYTSVMTRLPGCTALRSLHLEIFHGCYLPAPADHWARACFALPVLENLTLKLVNLPHITFLTPELLPGRPSTLRNINVAGNINGLSLSAAHPGFFSRANFPLLETFLAGGSTGDPDMERTAFGAADQVPPNLTSLTLHLGDQPMRYTYPRLTSLIINVVSPDIVPFEAHQIPCLEWLWCIRPEGVHSYPGDWLLHLFDHVPTLHEMSFGLLDLTTVPFWNRPTTTAAVRTLQTQWLPAHGVNVVALPNPHREGALNMVLFQRGTRESAWWKKYA